MRRLIVAGALVAAAAGIMPAAQAGVGGACDGKVDVACQEHSCAPDYPCTIEICLVWLGGACEI